MGHISSHKFWLVLFISVHVLAYFRWSKHENLVWVYSSIKQFFIIADYYLLALSNCLKLFTAYGASSPHLFSLIKTLLRALTGSTFLHGLSCKATSTPFVNNLWISICFLCDFYVMWSSFMTRKIYTFWNSILVSTLHKHHFSHIWRRSVWFNRGIRSGIRGQT